MINSTKERIMVGRTNSILRNRNDTLLCQHKFGFRLRRCRHGDLYEVGSDDEWVVVHGDEVQNANW